MQPVLLLVLLQDDFTVERFVTRLKIFMQPLLASLYLTLQLNVAELFKLFGAIGSLKLLSILSS